MRYFLEVGYKGTNYAGFQIQRNAKTIQGEIQKAFATFFKTPIELTGSSRTDAGVHAIQNFFHFDFEGSIDERMLYNINSLLPTDIVAKSFTQVPYDAHSRFHASSRKYRYKVLTTKNPFFAETAWYYPYKVDFDLLNKAATILYSYIDYTSFSKKNTQVNTHNCIIMQSNWSIEKELIQFEVEANRFLRGMVRGLVGTMLLVGRKKVSLSAFEGIIVSKDCTKANFATPAHGLFLEQVSYPSTIISNV